MQLSLMPGTLTLCILYALALMAAASADTEIDWCAYMQEVHGYLSGERDYMQLKGHTGPLVYPAAFVYAYAWLYKLTGTATETRRWQQHSSPCTCSCLASHCTHSSSQAMVH